MFDDSFPDWPQIFDKMARFFSTDRIFNSYHLFLQGLPIG